MTKKEKVDNYLSENFKKIEDWRTGKVLYWDNYQKNHKDSGEFSWDKVAKAIGKEIDKEYTRGRFSILRKKWDKGKVLKNEIKHKNFYPAKGTIKAWTTPALLPYLKGDPNNVLVIGDTHLPFCKEGYLEFCREQQEKYNCGTVVHIGDLVDNHAVSYHDSDPNGKSAGDEHKLALEQCKKWYEVFPYVKICTGNHDALPFRKAFTAGLPSNWLKSYQELFQSPKTWEWDFVHQVAGVIYQHGTGLSGEMASINCARENRQSTVIGHLHTVMNTRFLASYKDLIFGVSVGCGIDHKAYAFAYGKENTRKPVVGCSVVIGGKLPINIPMEI